jgi:hypothetical protein
MIVLFIISIIVLILNIPFGYWRANVKRFSLQWYLSIHIPVPIIIAFRIFFEIGFTWYTYLFLVTTFFLGQRLGSIIYKYLKKIVIVSSCLFMDLFRLVNNR